MNPSSCNDIRSAGWMLMAHHDMKSISGEGFVTWWFVPTRPDKHDRQKVWAIGSTDEEALTKIRLELGLPTNDEEEDQAYCIAHGICCSFPIPCPHCKGCEPCGDCHCEIERIDERDEPNDEDYDEEGL